MIQSQISQVLPGATVLHTLMSYAWQASKLRGEKTCPMERQPFDALGQPPTLCGSELCGKTCPSVLPNDVAVMADIYFCFAVASLA